ncbi:MAG TPA: hypothetical protein VF585_00710 [Chthoniobacterales bacterium]|jgi:hypothetical protein
MNTENDNLERDANPDPITGAPGSHPVATGVGAAGAGLTGAAIGTAVGGPVGGLVGSAIGAIVGGLAGKGVGEVVDPTTEDAYWRENHLNQSYASEGAYEDYSPGYRTGYEGYAKHGSNVGSFDEAEPHLRTHYSESNASVPWEKAKHASRAAWDRVADKSREVKDDVKRAL